MTKRTPIDLTFAITDIVLGVASLLFYVLGRFYSSYIIALSFLSTPFLISIALPAFILLAGITSVARVSFAPMISLFISFLAFVNSLAALFTITPPIFLAQGASEELLVAFHYIVPAAALGYFSARGLTAFLQYRRQKKENDFPSSASSPQETEFYCASCGERLRPQDEACPSCGELIRGRRCEACGHEARESEFIDGRCPHCGISEHHTNE